MGGCAKDLADLPRAHETGAKLDWRARKGNLCILQCCHTHHGSEHRPWPQEMAEIKIYNHKIIKKKIAVISSTKQTQPLSAQSLASYLVYQDQNVWMFFKFLGPAVLLEEQQFVEVLQDSRKKGFFMLQGPLCSGFDPA